MNVPTTAARRAPVPVPLITALLVTALVLLGGLLGATPAGAAPRVTAGPAATSTGWLRLAHLSPNAPAVDVYLYNFGNPDARVVLHHVSYGTVSAYQQVPAGEYTVSMRAAGAKGSAPPILSTGFAVDAGDAYTVAGMGPASGLRLQVMDDSTSAPAGKVLVRVIQASLSQHQVTMSLGHDTLARQLNFASTTAYQQVAAGSTVVKVAGRTEKASMDMSLAADTIHTIVVLDGTKGLRLANLDDAVGSQVAPVGGAATGLGGTAPRPAPAPWPWLAMIVAGVLLAGRGVHRYRAARTART
jgi:hypothetical protein